MMIEVKAPSNIAFLKYWGKADRKAQWPAGDSLSMTLQNAVTMTRCKLISSAFDDSNYKFSETEIRQKSKHSESTGSTPPNQHEAHSDVIVFDGQPKEDKKISTALSILRRQTGYQASLYLETKNTFPKSCGIASSASGMAALVIASLCAWTGSTSFDDLEKNGFTKNRLAHLARLCSGSAGRSLYGGYVEWLKKDSPATQSITCAFPADHWQLSDLILLVSKDEKSVGSTEAHDLAWSSPFFAPRISYLPEKLQLMKRAMVARDMENLGTLLEAEALEMHSVIMTATPPVNYLTKNTTALLSWIRESRKAGVFQAWFTIDAGPNIHLLSDMSEKPKIIAALKADHPDLEFIEDQTGNGPVINILV